MFINNNLNKGVSLPIAILVIMIVAVISGGLVLWQYSEIEKETVNFSETEDNEIKIDDTIIEDEVEDIEDIEDEKNKEDEKENLDLSIEKVSLEKRVGEDGKTRLYYDTVIKNVGNVSAKYFSIEYTLYNKNYCPWIVCDEDPKLGYICGKEKKYYQPGKEPRTKELSPGEFYYDREGFIHYGDGLHTVKIVISASGDSNKENDGKIEEIFIEKEGRSLSVVYPSGGQEFQKGSAMEIKWGQTGFEDKNTIDAYLLAYDDKGYDIDSKEEYGNYDQEYAGYIYIIKENIPVRDKKIIWTIPDDINQRFQNPLIPLDAQKPVAYYKIYIEYREGPLHWIMSRSRDYFTIN